MFRPGVNGAVDWHNYNIRLLVIFQPSTVQPLLISLKCNSLEQRRLRNRLQLLYRISSGLVDINLTGFCQHADPRTRGVRRLHLERPRHPVLFNSFFRRTVRDWNHLPTAITSAISHQPFWNQLGGSLHNLQIILTVHDSSS